MRSLDQCFYRSGDNGLAAAGQVFREEGRGLGFSIGGWHPFQISTYLPTLKKLDPLANTSLGRAVWKPIEKVNQTVNKDFAKTKKWSQEHRKQLQIAAAVALAAVGGMYAYGAFAAEGGAAGAAAGGVGTAAEASAAEAAAAEFGGAGLAPLGSTAATASAVGVPTVTSGVISTTAYLPETLTPLTASAAPSLSLVPATAPAAMVSTSSFAPIMASTSSGLTLGGVASTVGQWSPLLALGKMLGVVPSQQAAQQTADPYGYGYGAGGYGYGAGGGPGLGPLAPPAPDSVEAAVASLPPWAIPAAGAALLIYLLKD